MRRTCSPSWKASRTLIARSDASYSTWRPVEESRRPRAAGLGENQRHDEPGQRHQRRNPERAHQPQVVRHPAESHGPDAARADGEAHDKPRRQAGAAVSSAATRPPGRRSPRLPQSPSPVTSAVMNGGPMEIPILPPVEKIDNPVAFRSPATRVAVRYPSGWYAAIPKPDTSTRSSTTP